MIVMQLAEETIANAKPAATLGVAVQDHLEQAIVTGRLQPGAALKEVELASELGISATPIRDALAQLSRSGLVDIVSNKTKRVSPIDTAKMLDLLETRQVIMERLIRRMPGHVSANLPGQVEFQVEAIESALERGDVARAVIASVQIDTIIAAHCESPESHRILRSREGYVARHLITCLDEALVKRMASSTKVYLDALKRADAEAMIAIYTEGWAAIVERIRRSG